MPLWQEMLEWTRRFKGRLWGLAARHRALAVFSGIFGLRFAEVELGFSVHGVRFRICSGLRV